MTAPEKEKDKENGAVIHILYYRNSLFYYLAGNPPEDTSHKKRNSHSHSAIKEKMKRYGGIINGCRFLC